MGNKCCKSKQVRAARVKQEKETLQTQRNVEEMQKERNEREHQEMKELLNNLQQDLGEQKQMVAQQTESFDAHIKRETDTMEKLLDKLQTYENQLGSHEKRFKQSENNIENVDQKIDNLTLQFSSISNPASALQDLKEQFQNELNFQNKRSTEEQSRVMGELETLSSEQTVIKNQIERILQMIAELKKISVQQPSRKHVDFEVSPPKTHHITRHKKDHVLVPAISNPSAFECHLNEEICEWYKITQNNFKACYGAFYDSEKASLHRPQKFSSKGLLQFICLQDPRHDKYKCHICRHVDLSDVPALP